MYTVLRSILVHIDIDRRSVRYSFTLAQVLLELTQTVVLESKTYFPPLTPGSSGRAYHSHTARPVPICLLYLLELADFSEPFCPSIPDDAVAVPSFFLLLLLVV